MAYKDLLGVVAIVIALVSYIPYFKDTFSGKTKPHPFSWFVWGLVTAIGFAGQIVGNAGPGAWVTGFTAAVCFTISITAFIKNGRENIVLVDWLCLAGAGLSLFLWYLTKGPLLSVILISIVDGIAFLPTFRKSFSKPYEETIITYTLSGLKFVLALFALEIFSVITVLYPLSLVIMNWLFVGMLFVRRRQLPK